VKSKQLLTQGKIVEDKILTGTDCTAKPADIVDFKAGRNRDEEQNRAIEPSKKTRSMIMHLNTDCLVGNIMTWFSYRFRCCPR